MFESVGDNALEDVQLRELQNYIEAEDAVSDDEQVEEMQDDTAESNRGQRYVGQGKKDHTVWWSVLCSLEKDRTQAKKRTRGETYPYVKQIFDEKKVAFMRILPAIIELIVIETNRKAKRAYEARWLGNLNAARPKNIRHWTETDADEIYSYISKIKQYKYKTALRKIKHAVLSCHNEFVPF